MKRVGGLWPQLVDFHALCAAARRAARGKRRVANVARFLLDLEPEVLRLGRELESGDWRPGRACRFEIRDPKRRTITAAPFRDRVVHHALMAPLEPVFERRMIGDSYACRRGKGTRAALGRAQELVRRQDWFLKLDVAKFFESLDHDIVLETVARSVKDRAVLQLCQCIVRAGGCRGRGLPIGNLTSQWFANLVLDRLDHYIKEELRPGGYLRYMDDFVLYSRSKGKLVEAHSALETFLGDRLGLRLKSRATILAPTRQGLPFLGWRIYRGVRRIRPENLRRLAGRLKHRSWEFRRGIIPEETLHASVSGVCEHLRQGSTLALRRSLFEGLGAGAGGRSPPGEQ